MNRNIFLILSLIIMVGRSGTCAGTAYWSGGDPTTSWSAGDNWSGGTGPAGIPAATQNVVFGNVGNSTSITAISNTVDSSFPGIISSLAFTNSVSGSYQNTLIAPGVTLTITNKTGPFGSALFVGTPTAAAAAASTFASIQGPGAILNVSNSSACISISQSGGSTALATLILTNLDNFSAQVSLIAIGDYFYGIGASAAQGQLFLARTNYISTAWVGNYASPYSMTQTNAIQLGEGSSSTLGGINGLFLGQSNAFFTDSIGVGGIKAGGTASGCSVMAFAQVFTNSSPTAYFRGIGGDASPITYWGVGDTAVGSSSSARCFGRADFSYGSVDALVDTMILGRDRNGAATDVDDGTFTFTAGNVNVNTLLIGDQGSANTGCVAAGAMNVNGPGAVLTVNNTLELGLTTLTVAPAPSASGTLTINSGTVNVSNVIVGAVSITNSIAMNNATLIVSNSLAANAAGLFSLTMTNSTLGLTIVDTSAKALVQTLTTGGNANTIQLAAVPVFANYPVQIPLIQYATLNGAGFNFVLGSVPASAPGAFLSNNVNNSSIDLCLPESPASQPVAPAISGLNDQTNLVGTVATISATVSGSPLPALQWQLNGTNLADGAQADGSIISGSATSTLMITNVQSPTGQGTYSLIASNSSGAVTNSMNLTVWTSWPISPAMPVIPPTVFNVTNYGAVGDGATDNTISIQNTINAASAAGGGIVEIPAGTYLSGPITLASKINLQIDTNALLQMLPLGVYPGGTTSAQTFIYCNAVHDLEISGGGAIDGQGAAWWAAYAANSSIVRPMMLDLWSCNRLFIHDVTFQNPPYHHCGIRQDGGNVTISNLTVNTASTSPNTDGLDFVGTNSIIENCHISDGDDNVAMGSGGPINGLLITNCTFGSGHGVSIGSGISVGVSNLTVVNCTFNGTVNGIRIKCNQGNSAPLNNLNYLGLSMTNVSLPIVIYSYYNDTGTPDNITPAEVLAASNTAPITATTPVWSNITISNLTATSPTMGGIIWGPTEMPISNLTLVDITNTAPKTMDLYNVYNAKIIDSQFNFSSGNTYTLCNAGVTISNSVPAGNPVTIGGAPSVNSLALYNALAAMASPNLFSVNPLVIGGSLLTNSVSLSLPAGSVQNFSLGTNSSTVVVSGNLTLNSTLNVTNAGGFTATNYTLFSYTGTLSGQPVLGATPASVAGYTYSLDTSTPGQVNFLVTPPATMPGISALNDQTNLVGTVVTINAVVSGSPSPVLQWQLNGVNLADGVQADGSIISGSATGTLTISNVQYPTGQGAYSLIASNSAGAVTNSMNLTVAGTPPGISGLNDQTSVVGTVATLSAVVTGLPSPTLQWELNGIVLSDGVQADGSIVSGSATGTLTISNVQYPTGQGTYSLIASNFAGAVTNSMSLTVVGTLPAISGLNNQTNLVGTVAIIGAVVTGLPSPALQWRLNGINLADGVQADGSIISGSATGTLTIADVQYPTSQGTYSLIASNVAGAATNSMNLTVASAPNISGLNDQTNLAGTVATFSAVVSGSPSPALQWQLDGTNLADGLQVDGSIITGSTSSTLVITNVQSPTSQGTYSLIASNWVGAATNSLNLTVVSAPNISGLNDQTNLVGTVATLSAVVSGSPSPALQWLLNGINLADGLQADGSVVSGSATGTLTIANVQSPTSQGTYSLIASNSVGAVTNSLNLTVVSAPTISGLNDQTNLAGTVATLNAVVSGSPSPALQWQLNGIPLVDGLQPNGSIISGSASSTLTITNVQFPSSQGTYSLIASNWVGAITNSLSLTVVIQSTPCIDRIVFNPSHRGLIFSGTGGVPGGRYYVLISTNANLPPSQWKRLATHSFDANGNFTFTCEINRRVPRLYYQLQVP
jgi:LEA14-like dessication related protein